MSSYQDRLNSFYGSYCGGEQRPQFYDIATTKPELSVLKRHYSDIRNELEPLMSMRESLPKYHELDEGTVEISESDKDWNTVPLYILGWKPKKTRDLCPVTSKLLDGIPGVIQAQFSILEAGKSIPAHNGPSLGYLRYHLGIIVPTPAPRIRIKDQFYEWKEGEEVLFDDSWDHEVINNCPADRAVLMVDVLRPLPWFPSFINTVFFSLIKYTFGRQVFKNLSKNNFFAEQKN